MTNPDKHVRKAIKDAVNGLYPVFDTQVTGSPKPTEYILLTTQSKELDNSIKCGSRWNSTTLIDFVTIYNGAGNVGSRVAVNDMQEAVFNLLKNLQVSGFTVEVQTFEFPDDLDLSTATQNVYRNFIRLNLLLA